MRAYRLSWNYRVVQNGNMIGMKEVYYEEDSTKIHGWSENFMYPFGSDLAELLDDFERMRDAFDKPILVEKGDSLEEASGT